MNEDFIKEIVDEIVEGISLKSIRKAMKWGRLVPHGMCMLVSRGTPHFVENHNENNEMEAIDPPMRTHIGLSNSFKTVSQRMKWEGVKIIDNRQLENEMGVAWCLSISFPADLTITLMKLGMKFINEIH